MASSLKKRKSEGSGKHCVVVGCNNISRKLAEWKQETCQIHATQIHGDRSCVQPYQMHCIPCGPSANSQAKLNQWMKKLIEKTSYLNNIVQSVYFLKILTQNLSYSIAFQQFNSACTVIFINSSFIISETTMVLIADRQSPWLFVIFVMY